MAISSLQDVKDELAFTADVGSLDDGLLQRKLDAAQNHIERLLGYKIAATFGGAGQDPVPLGVKEAVTRLAAHWYDNRELVGEGREVPFGVTELVSEYREFTF